MVLQAVTDVKPWLAKGPVSDEKNLALNMKLFSQALGKRPELIADRLERLLNIEAALTLDSLAGDMADKLETFSRLVSWVVLCNNCVFAKKTAVELRAQRICPSHELLQENR